MDLNVSLSAEALRNVGCGNRLRIVWNGEAAGLKQHGDGLFRVGDGTSPEYIALDTIIDGEAWKAH